MWAGNKQFVWRHATRIYTHMEIVSSDQTSLDMEQIWSRKLCRSSPLYRWMAIMLVLMCIGYFLDYRAFPVLWTVENEYTVCETIARK